MNLLLAIFQLDRQGGKERDCIAVAHHLAKQGHGVTILTTSAKSNLSDSIRLVTLTITGFSNHTRAQAFAEAVECYKKRSNAVLFSFERIPGSDFFYAADNPTPDDWSWPPRRRSRMALENGVFSKYSKTHVFFLTSRQRDEYVAIYGFDPLRGTVLPMILHDDRYEASLRNCGQVVRDQLGLSKDAVLAVSVATNPKLKGVDRILDALPLYPSLNLLIIGSDKWWLRQRVRRLRLKTRVHILPYFADVMDVISAADFLVHPARAEAAGQVIGEALLAGVPAIVSAACGYAGEIEATGAGIVLSEPFRQDMLVAGIAELTRSLPIARKAAAKVSLLLHEHRGLWLSVIAREIEHYAQ